jgi:hypothetical protein
LRIRNEKTIVAARRMKIGVLIIGRGKVKGGILLAEMY